MVLRHAGHDVTVAQQTHYFRMHAFTQLEPKTYRNLRGNGRPSELSAFCDDTGDHELSYLVK